MNCPSQEAEVTSTPTRPVDNVVITTKGLQDRNIHILDGTTVENKGKLIHCSYIIFGFAFNLSHCCSFVLYRVNQNLCDKYREEIDVIIRSILYSNHMLFTPQK